MLEIHPSARKHGIADEDIEHAVTHAMAIDDTDDDARLYLGPARNAALLRVPRSTVYELTRSRRLPFVKVGRRTLFVRVDLDAWVVANRVTPRQ